MSINTYFRFDTGLPVSINSKYVVSFHPEPDNEELITIELANGKKYSVKAKHDDVRKWVEKG
jgi:uncharacterized protein YlzI (FlbEa/FlbD family)